MQRQQQDRRRGLAAPVAASFAAVAPAASSFGGCPPSPVICTRAEVGRACGGEGIAQWKKKSSCCAKKGETKRFG